jgi:hypothetical protein
MMRRFLHWFFRNGETGAVTITQAPNLVLWIVIVAGFSGSGLRQAIRVLLQQSSLKAVCSFGRSTRFSAAPTRGGALLRQPL